MAAKRRLKHDEVVTLAAGVRATAADLAIARAQYVGEPVADELEALLGRGRAAMDRPVPADVPAALVRLWRALVRDLDVVVAAAGLLLVGVALGATWNLLAPADAVDLLSVAERRDLVAGGTPIAVTLLLVGACLVGGLAWGIGAALAVVFTGVRYGVLVTTMDLSPIIGLDVLTLAGVALLGSQGLRLGQHLLQGGRGEGGLSAAVRAGVEVVALAVALLLLGALRLAV